MSVSAGAPPDAARPVHAPVHDEPDLLRDQFRQLLHYRWLILIGVLLGVLGGGWLGVGGGDAYTATTETTVRPLSTDTAGPDAPRGEISMGSERRTALSSVVAERAADDLKTSTGTSPSLRPGGAPTLAAGLQVTNPPETQMLRFAYTAANPKTAARNANAFAEAYLDNRQDDAAASIDRTVRAYEKQRKPLVKERDRLADEIAGAGERGALDGTVSAHASAVTSIAELSSSISTLRAQDTTPGRVVTKATPPAAPAGPGLALMLGLGAAVGIGLGLLAAWVRLVFDPVVRTPGDVVRALHAPVLGTLPRPRRFERFSRKGRAGGGRDGGRGRGQGRGRGGRGSLLVDGRLAEEYRSVAFRLAYDETFARRRRILVVSPRGSIASALATSVNLSASFAEMGKDVLLVEADLRTPSLTERLQQADGVQPGWARAPGHGTIGWPAGLRVPIDAGESGVFDLVPGHRVSKVPRALTSSAATQLIAHADQGDSVLVVLAPAVLSYADAIALIDRVDCVLIVCDPREVRRDELVRARELVVGAGGVVLGALLHSHGGGSEPKGGPSPLEPPSSPSRARPSRGAEPVHETVGLRVMDR
ncbi:lipopolysaccharide biosynthesis protein [Streptomyces sp. NBC_01775]|uniref:lipopolysaccharide biosynthesis protein n=1 Tax=Streptomyces sp. NBC_01775 TaxID=2975939 RepID=UPI002DDA800D|nr:lipopolysaccharide biosynthesis protein [Streptomyces sp. NBC_01775]WSB79511.1 lipopolysaccharide biosynthesis protein [Streptomyces sp. NBC_01775]